MTAIDVLRFSSGALRGHGLRTALSVLGVAIGVASVVMLTALGQGARTYVTDQFASLGTNILIIVPGKVETSGGMPGIGGVPSDLTIDDADALRRGRAVRNVAPVAMGNETVSHGGRSRQVAVIGSTYEMLEVRDITMRSGSFLPQGDWDRGTSVAVIGEELARELYPGLDPVGQVLRVGDFRMRVIGVMAPRGMTLGIDLDSIVMVPLATGMRLFNRTTLFRIMVQHDPLADVDLVSAEARRILMERHDGAEDFTLITQDAVMSAFAQIFDALTAALAGIAAISLAVAGIGIMNVMLVSVSERTHEVGLLKAVGARSGQILAAFLTEAILLSSLGGVAGLAFAWAALGSVGAAYPAIDFTPPNWAIASALIVSLAVGALFGVLPARHATRMDPIAALRS